MASNAFLWCVSVCLCVRLRLGTNNPFSTSSPQWLGAGYLTVEIWDGFLKLAGKISKIFFFFLRVSVSFFLAAESYSGARGGVTACSSTRTHLFPQRLLNGHPKKRAKRLWAHPWAKSPWLPKSHQPLGWEAMSPTGIQTRLSHKYLWTMWHLKIQFGPIDFRWHCQGSEEPLPSSHPFSPSSANQKKKKRKKF